MFLRWDNEANLPVGLRLGSAVGDWLGRPLGASVGMLDGPMVGATAQQNHRAVVLCICL